MPALDNSELDLPEILYEYWDTIPIILDVGKHFMTKLGEKEAQRLIIHSLSQGITDDYPSGLRKRHAMTATEIQEIMKSNYNFEINKSNLYYHLQKLVDNKIIQIATTVQTSNIVTSFYGRTSKLIFAEFMEENEKGTNKKKEAKLHHPMQKLLKSKQLHVLIKSYNSEETFLDEIETLIEQVTNHGFEHNRDFLQWMIENEEHFQGNDIDLIDFNQLYNQMKSYNDNLDQLFKLLKDTFKL